MKVFFNNFIAKRWLHLFTKAFSVVALITSLIACGSGTSSSDNQAVANQSSAENSGRKQDNPGNHYGWDKTPENPKEPPPNSEVPESTSVISLPSQTQPTANPNSIPLPESTPSPSNTSSILTAQASSSLLPIASAPIATTTTSANILTIEPAFPTPAPPPSLTSSDPNQSSSISTTSPVASPTSTTSTPELSLASSSSPEPSPTCSLTPTNPQPMALTIDVGLYTGPYRIFSDKPFVVGPQTFSVMPGNFTFSTRTHSFGFTIDSCQSVQSLNPMAARGDIGILKLNTLAVNIKSNGFSRVYSISFSSNITGDHSTGFIVGLMEGICTAGGRCFSYVTVAQDGGITILNGFTSLIVSNSTIELKTVSYFIDPGTFDRGYYLQGSSGLHTLPQTTTGIVDTVDAVLTPEGLHLAQYRLSEDATITLISGFNSVSISTGVLTFLTTSISIDPLDYDRTYTASGSKFATGPQKVNVIPEAINNLIGAAGVTIFSFTAKSDGQINMRTNADGAVVEQGKITFKTVGLEIDPGYYKRNIYPAGGKPFQGIKKIIAVVGGYDLLMNGAGLTLGAFVASADGTIINKSPNSMATTSHRINVKNVQIDIYPGSSSEIYNLVDGVPNTGTTTEVGIPGTQDQLHLNNGNHSFKLYDTFLNFNGSLNPDLGPNGFQFKVRQ